MSDVAAISPFHSGTKIQYAWDSTSLGWFKECPRKYYYSMIEGWRSRGTATPLTFGLHYHSSLEKFDHLRSEGQSYEDALDGAVQHCLFISHGWESDDPNRNRYTLLRSIIWYLEHFKDDPARTIILSNGKPAVELSFRLDLTDEIVICGHLDRVVEFQDSLYVMDRKTTKTTISSYYFDQYSPDNQMSLYTAASQIIYKTPVKGVIIDAAQVAVGFTRFERGFTHRTGEQIEEWIYATKQHITLAQTMADLAEQDHPDDPAAAWPMNDKSCHNYGGCVFRKICSKDPRVRQTFLESDFERRPWNPLEVR